MAEGALGWGERPRVVLEAAGGGPSAWRPGRARGAVQPVAGPLSHAFLSSLAGEHLHIPVREGLQDLPELLQGPRLCTCAARPFWFCTRTHSSVRQGTQIPRPT